MVLSSKIAIISIIMRSCFHQKSSLKRDLISDLLAKVQYRLVDFDDHYLFEGCDGASEGVCEAFTLASGYWREGS